MLVPSVCVDTGCQEPEHQRTFTQEAGRDVPRIQMVCEGRRNVGKPGESPKRHQYAKDSRQKAGPQDEIAGEEAVKSVKDESSIDASEVPFEGFECKSCEVGHCCEQGETSVYQLQDSVEKQSDGNKKEDRNKPRCVKHASVDKGFGEYGREDAEKVERSGEPCFDSGRYRSSRFGHGRRYERAGGKFQCFSYGPPRRMEEDASIPIR